MSKFIKIYDCNSNQPVILNIEAIAKIQYEPGANNYRIALYSNGSDTHVDRKNAEVVFSYIGIDL